MSDSASKLSPLLGVRNVTLHIWPRYEQVFSFDVSSAAALLFLQLTIPGQFSIAYCANPDLSPSGQLPLLTHGLYHVSGLGPIIAYVRKQSNARQLDAHLSPVQGAQLTARIAHIESSYGDLVNHMLYSLQENWSNVTRQALVTMLPIPQRYYVPSRIRASHKARLEAVELWHVPEVEDEPEEPKKVLGRRKKLHPENEQHKFKTVFEREKVMEKARALFDVYDRLLGDGRFFMQGDDPTTLDVVFAAHTHLLLNLQFPDPLVTSILTESYPRLIAHCEAVLSTSFPDSSHYPPTVQKGWYSSLKYMIPWPRTSTLRRSTSAALLNAPEVQKEEWRYRLWRWGFIGVSLFAALTYLRFTTIVIVLPERPSARLLPSEEAVHEGEEEGEEEDAEGVIAENDDDDAEVAEDE